MTIFEISNEFIALESLLNEDDYDCETGEFIDNSELIAKLFDDISLTMNDKLDSTQRYILSLLAESDTLTKEAQRLQARKKGIDNKAERLKGLILQSLITTKQDKIKTALYNFAIRTTESVSILNVDELDRKYLKMKLEPDKIAIKKAIKDGIEVSGAEMQENKSLGVR